MNRIKISILIFTFLFSFTGTSQAQEQLNAAEIIEKSNDLRQGASSYNEMKMTIVRPTWERTMTMKAWSLGDDFSLTLVTGPARDKGTAFLKRDKEMWNWQPSIDRSIKMPPSMMGQSWMGSDFTNDDLVRSSSIVNDYEYRLLESETIEGRECHVIELIPKEETAVVWGKVLMWVSKKNYLQLKTEFYDEDDYLVNTMLGKDIKTIGGRELPAIMEVIPAEEEGHKTIIEILALDFGQSIKESYFSVQNMKRVR